MPHAASFDFWSLLRAPFRFEIDTQNLAENKKEQTRAEQGMKCAKKRDECTFHRKVELGQGNFALHSTTPQHSAQRARERTQTGRQLGWPWIINLLCISHANPTVFHVFSYFIFILQNWIAYCSISRCAGIGKRVSERFIENEFVANQIGRNGIYRFGTHRLRFARLTRNLTNLCTGNRKVIALNKSIYDSPDDTLTKFLPRSLPTYASANRPACVLCLSHSLLFALDERGLGASTS